MFLFRHASLALPVLLGYLLGQTAYSQSNASQPSTKYTIAYRTFAPDNLDIFVAAGDGSNPRPLVPHPALDYNASFSYDGRWIIFTSHRGGTAAIYRVRQDGSQLERLTFGGSFDDQGALSPDGKSLAFVSSRAGQADVWILDLQTRKLTNLTHHPAGDFRPSWSPDGQWIAFTSGRDPARTSCAGTVWTGPPGRFVTPQFTGVFVVHPDGTGLRRISKVGESAGTPHWSPDGSRLVFFQTDLDTVCQGGLLLANGPSQIVAVDWRTGTPQTITFGLGLKVFPRWFASGEFAFQTRGGIRFSSGSEISGDFESPDWSPDRSRMVFHRRIEEDSLDWTPMISKSLDLRFALLPVPGAATLSPDGDQVAYLRPKGTVSAGDDLLAMSDVDGSRRRIIHERPNNQNIVSPSWSPNGDAILFGEGGFFNRSGQSPGRIMSIQPDGSGLTALTAGTDNSAFPSWSPDGKQVVYRVAQGDERGLRILDVRTGTSRKLETGSDYDTFPTWSPRGNWIAFVSKRDGDYEIYRIHPDGSGVQRLTRAPGVNAHPSFSPDGEWIAFTTGRQGFKDEAIVLLLEPPVGTTTFQTYGEIAVMHADGSGLRMLTDNSVEDGGPSWLPTPKRHPHRTAQPTGTRP